MRRSGTSILQKILNSCQQINLEFEPHELWFAIQTVHIGRYNKSTYHLDTIQRFKNGIEGCGYYGAKFAVNAGIEAMNWRWLEDKFSGSCYVFISRNSDDTYASWAKLDSTLGVRGICSKEMYVPWHTHINESFIDFSRDNPERAIFINYEELVTYPDTVMEPVWKMLNLKSKGSIKNYIRKPENWSIT